MKSMYELYSGNLEAAVGCAQLKKLLWVYMDHVGRGLQRLVQCRL